VEKPNRKEAQLCRIIFQFGSENETETERYTKEGRGRGKDVKNFLTIDLKSFLKLAEIDCLLYTNRPKSSRPHTHMQGHGQGRGNGRAGKAGKAGENGGAAMERK